MEDDPEYVFFLQNLRVCGDSYAIEIQREGFSGPVLVKYEEEERVSVVNPRRKRIRGSESQIGAGVVEVGPVRPRVESDLFDLGRDRCNLISGVRSVVRDAVVKIENEEVGGFGREIDLVERKDGFFEREGGEGETNSADDSVIAKVVNEEERDSELSEETSKNTVLAESDKTKEIPSGSRGTRDNSVRNSERDEVKKGEKSQIKPPKQESYWVEEIKKRSFTKCSEFTNSSDSDEEIRHEIPIEMLNRPESEYKEKLIEYLSSPFNKKEYKVLMKRAARRSKKILSKETRRGVRYCETDELSKSYFDWYPGRFDYYILLNMFYLIHLIYDYFVIFIFLDFARQVEKAEKGRQWFLLRGFFFWLQVEF
ncbi:hypothetical protein LUZ60_016378 [Juncus effusus]|nr:hypothetical protein LUZ60_016378 [Juncus effusus]